MTSIALLFMSARAAQWGNVMSSRLVRWTVLAAFMFVLLFAEPTAANFGDTTTTPPNGSVGVSLANNKWHAVRNDNASSARWSAITWAVNGPLDNTDLVAYTTSTDWVPDVWVQQAFLGIAPVAPSANVRCPTYNTGYGGPNLLQWCRGQQITFNTNYGHTGSYGRFVACHELGHTVGLRHRTGWGCMEVRGQGGGSYPSDYTSHDKNHINGWY